jgi:hypothetical protein
MKVVLSKKNMLIIAGVLIVGLILFLIIRRFRTKSTYTTTDDTVDSTRYNTMKNNLQKCANALQKDLIDHNGTNTQAGLDTYNECLSSNVNQYVSNVCPASISGVTPDSCPPNAKCDLPDWQSKYDDYQQDLRDIQDAYIEAIASADEAQKVIVRAARRADMTGATRRYLSRTCTNFYQPATTGLPDPTTIYQGWTTSGTTGSYRFDPANVTMDKINSWAAYAGSPSANPPTQPLKSGTNTYTSSPPSSDFVFVPEQTGVTFPYWALARDIGPGTVLTTGTVIPVSFTSGTTSYTVKYTAPATIFP